MGQKIEKSPKKGQNHPKKAKNVKYILLFVQFFVLLAVPVFGQKSGIYWDLGGILGILLGQIFVLEVIFVDKIAHLAP